MGLPRIRCPLGRQIVMSEAGQHPLAKHLRTAHQPNGRDFSVPEFAKVGVEEPIKAS